MTNESLACVAIGSNLGDRHAHLDWAIERLSNILIHPRASAVIETDPVDVPDVQSRYLNAVIVGQTDLSARDLLDVLLGLEQKRGRERRTWHQARTLDLDLIFYGDQVIDEPGLTVPHPQMRGRHFVLGPLVEVEPLWRDPVSGLTARELLENLEAKKKGA